MTDRDFRHRSYVLRLWEVQSGGERAWRASLQSPDTGERHAFGDVQSLFRFLERTTEVPLEPDRPTDIPHDV